MRSSSSTPQVYQRRPTEPPRRNGPSTRVARTSRAGGGRSSRPAAGRAARSSARSGSRSSSLVREHADAAAVGRHLHVLLARAVGHRQRVARRHHQRARRERVRRDEGDDVALHAPGQHGPAVGEVVAGRARRAWPPRARRSAPRRAARPRPSSASSATRPRAAPVERDVVDARAARPAAVDATRPGSSITSKSPASAQPHALVELARGSTVARKPIAPKLNANTGTSRRA